jgi:GDP-4-dehydro-6-deoxy-D-mannose reductase
MRILITGATGFIGGHLADHLRSVGLNQIFGIGRPVTSPIDFPFEHHSAELTDTSRVSRILQKVRPDWLFHLAGFANTARSYQQPAQCWADNLDGTRSLYDAVAESGIRPRILFVSTGLIYGDPPPDGSPFDECAELRPGSPYAASKAAADLLSYQQTRSPGLDIVRVRLFNQVGPRQSPDFAIANFAAQIAEVEAGKKKTIETGDLSAERDLTDIRDVVVAFRLLMEKGVPGEAYNAGSGRTRRIRDVLNRFIALANIAVEVREKPDPNRKADAAVTRVNAGKIAAATGWRPTLDFDETLRDILDWWRIKVRESV